MAETRVTVVFDERSTEILQNLQRAKGNCSIGDVLRDALGFYEWARVQTELGLDIGTLQKDGKPFRVVEVPFTVTLE